jgi:tetratricopeptide (TPR) repeat protein
MAEEDLGSALKQYERDLAEEWKNKADEFYGREDYQNAIECYKITLSKNPASPDAWNSLGLAYMKTGNIDEARNCHEQMNRLQSPEKSGDLVPSAPPANTDAAPQVLLPSTIDRRPFWLGLFGGVIGILMSLVGFLLDAIYALIGRNPGSAAWLTTASLVFSIAGMICGMTGRTRNAALLMIICGIVVLVATQGWGILVTIFFVVGGYILYENEKAGK